MRKTIIKYKNFIENAVFSDENFVETPFQKGEYENCIFKNCLLNETDLSHCVFSECTWINCNLSMANVSNTAFRGNRFQDCKLLGLRFDACNTLGLVVKFEKCILNYASFYKLKLKNLSFVV